MTVGELLQGAHWGNCPCPPRVPCCGSALQHNQCGNENCHHYEWVIANFELPIKSMTDDDKTMLQLLRLLYL